MQLGWRSPEGKKTFWTWELLLGLFFLLSKDTISTLVVPSFLHPSFDDYGSYAMTLPKNVSSTQFLGPSPFLRRPHEAWYTPLSSTKLMPAFPGAWVLTGSVSWIGGIEIRKKNLTCRIIYCDGPTWSSNLSGKSPSSKVFVHLQNISAEIWLWDFPKQKSHSNTAWFTVVQWLSSPAGPHYRSLWMFLAKKQTCPQGSLWPVANIQSTKRRSSKQ